MAYLPIPVSTAKKVAKEFNKDEVMIIAWDDETNQVHVTTYGSTEAHCDNAAKGSKVITEYLIKSGLLEPEGGVVYEDEHSRLG